MSASRKHKIAPVPDAWKTAVIAILKKGGHADVLWTGRAQSNWQSIGDSGFKDEAHDFLIRQLRSSGLLGHDHPDMLDSLDHSICETWAFLCPHPQGFPTQIYAKIALHGQLIRINLISLHIDLTKELENAIHVYLQPKKS